uniref:Coiled-coil domain containing 155 n=1 Tax=Monodelphis domestica TaxID=13616 RepID=A0A5F8GV48_MONDO
MQGWIATCQLGPGLELEDEAAGEPSLPPSGASAQPESYGDEETEPELLATAELLSSLEELELSNRRLAGENAKLQRSVETADEGAARLGEELASLRKQLRSSQQALQFAKAVDEELEDMKSLAKSLEEKNRSLVAQARQTEKEQQQLVAEVETLQEENGKLLAERDGVKKRSEELAMEKEALRRQLCEYESLICHRDTILSERTNRTENLTEALEEYRATIQELKQKISHLEEQLSQSREGPEGFQDGTQGIAGGWMKLHPQSLCLEIEAIQQITGQEKSSELLGSLEEENPWLLGERDHQRASQKGMRPPDTAGCLGTLEGPQFGDRPCPDARSSPSDVALLQAIEPLVGQLPSAGRRRQRRTSWELYPTPVAAPTPR